MLPDEKSVFSIVILLAFLAVWDLVWRSLALWKSARHGQTAWFVFLLLVNSLGILPIVYLQFFQKKSRP